MLISGKVTTVPYHHATKVYMVQEDKASFLTVALDRADSLKNTTLETQIPSRFIPTHLSTLSLEMLKKP